MKIDFYGLKCSNISGLKHRFVTASGCYTKHTQNCNTKFSCHERNLGKEGKTLTQKKKQKAQPLQ